MNKDDFTAQIMQIEGALYGVARTYLQSPHDCADAVQEAVLSAWKSRHRLRQAEYFKTWMIRIVINQCKTMIRKRDRLVPMEAVPEPPPDATDPLLYEGVMALDIKYRLPFVLHYVEGYATKEIAGMLHLPKGTVLSRLHRARQLLKETWSEKEMCRHEA